MTKLLIDTDLTMADNLKLLFNAADIEDLKAHYTETIEVHIGSDGRDWHLSFDQLHSASVPIGVEVDMIDIAAEYELDSPDDPLLWGDGFYEKYRKNAMSAIEQGAFQGSWDYSRSAAPHGSDSLNGYWDKGDFEQSIIEHSHASDDFSFEEFYSRADMLSSYGEDWFESLGSEEKEAIMNVHCDPVVYRVAYPSETVYTTEKPDEFEWAWEVYTHDVADADYLCTGQGLLRESKLEQSSSMEP